MSESSSPVVTLETRFGTFEVMSQAIIVFPDGLPGFEACRRFVLLSSEALAPLQCLHAMGGEVPSFLAIDPGIVRSGYQSEFDPGDWARLGGLAARQLVWLALITLDPDGTHSTVNLRAPVVINPETMVGMQIVSDDPVHSVRHALAA